MTDLSLPLFHGPEDGPPTRLHATGVLPHQAIEACIEAGIIRSALDVDADQVQPASLDLRLGSMAYRVRASFLPGATGTVERRLDSLSMYTLDLTGSAVLERGCVYIVPLVESVHLPPELSGIATPKSSTGRLDIFTRLMTDYTSEFERVAAGYKGKLYVEVSPRTFSIVAHAGDRLNQLRLKRGASEESDAGLEQLHRSAPLVFRDGAASDRPDIAGGLWVSVDLKGKGPGQPIAYRARRHAPLLDLRRIGHYAPADFWEPIYPDPSGTLILDPDAFYILASKETIRVPPDQAAEMVAYDTTVGEFRAHYAGFFDPGFGHDPEGGSGTCAVLEVRTHEVPFLLEDGQRVGRLVYERLVALPRRLYGRTIGSNYARQGLKLAKQFAPFEPGVRSPA